MQGLREDVQVSDDPTFSWVCRYYRYLHPGEDLDPCIEMATKQVWSRVSGDAFTICDNHFDREAEVFELEVLREL